VFDGDRVTPYRDVAGHAACAKAGTMIANIRRRLKATKSFFFFNTGVTSFLKKFSNLFKIT
jgi:hypothetical protein